MKIPCRQSVTFYNFMCKGEMYIPMFGHFAIDEPCAGMERYFELYIANIKEMGKLIDFSVSVEFGIFFFKAKFFEKPSH